MPNFTKIAAIMIVASLALAGFGCQQQAPADSGLEEASGSLNQLLAGAERPAELSYDIVYTGPDGNSMTTKMYTKGTEFRQESTAAGQKIIILGDFDGDVYTYYPVQNIAMKINFQDTEVQEQIEEDPFQVLEDLRDKVSVLGYEYIGEKKCLVVEYDMQNGTNLNQKMWIWERYGMPIKIETATPQGTATIEYKNIETGNVSDSLFELPEGVSITNFEDLMQGNFDPALLQGLGQ